MAKPEIRNEVGRPPGVIRHRAESDVWKSNNVSAELSTVSPELLIVDNASIACTMRSSKPIPGDWRGGTARSLDAPLDVIGLTSATNFMHGPKGHLGHGANGCVQGTRIR